MDKVTIAVAILSLAVSMLTAGWTIYRDAIQKPKFRVSLGIKSIHQAGRPIDGPFIFVEALNLGPIPNRLGLVFARYSWWDRYVHGKKGGAFIYPDFNHIGTTPAATRLEVGDQGSFVFPYEADCFLSEPLVQIGVADGFSRLHWAPRKQMREAQKAYRERFHPAT